MAPPYSTSSHVFIFIILVLPSVHLTLARPQPIRTIVVLVLENRSFDHMIGWMKNTINPKINGVTGDECNPVVNHTKTDSICFTDDAEFIDPDPGHSFEDVAQQVFGSGTFPSMSGFAQQAGSVSDQLSEAVMKGFRPESVPVYAELVKEFAVFDRWFSSIPGPTQPNRLFTYSATSHGSVSHIFSKLASGYPQRTIFDSLYDDGLDFGIYFQQIPTTFFFRNMRKLKYILNYHPYDFKFKRDAKNGKLPRLSVIEPRYFDALGIPANDDHPSHDVANGQKLVKEVYEALRSSPQWNETLFLITYDEHGGFYDHVKTPFINVPSPDGIDGPAPHFFRFDRVGVRVPTIMVSPWIKKGTVVSRASGPSATSEYEHSSIPATIKKIFNLSSNFLTRRDAWAGTFEHVVSDMSFPRTDCPDMLPDPVLSRRTKPNEGKIISEFQTEMVQLAAVLSGDGSLTSYWNEKIKNLSVKDANTYIKGAVSRFIRASIDALNLGADKSSIVNMRSSLTTRSSRLQH